MCSDERKQNLKKKTQQIELITIWFMVSLANINRTKGVLEREHICQSMCV